MRELRKTVISRVSLSCYFPGGTTPARRVVQNPVRGVLKEQTQPATAQGWLRLHLPPQVTPLASLRSWWTETAPAHRAEAMMVANNVVLAIFLNIVRTLS